jgi:hypothetical protein
MSAIAERQSELLSERAALEIQRRSIQADLTNSKQAYRYVDTGQEADRHYGSQILEQIDSRLKVIKEELEQMPSGGNQPIAISVDPLGADNSTYATGS